MLHLFSGLDFLTSILLIISLLFVLIYEFINGFHDTANAVATVIYTRAIKSSVAVIIAGIFNFIGVVLGGLSVAYAIIHLLPSNLLLNIDSIHGISIIFAILLAAIFWNLGTWYLGIPSSSSHTLIGSIIGIAITNSLITKSSINDALNINKMFSIFTSLVFSPILGFFASGLLILCFRYFFQKKYSCIHMTPLKQEKIRNKKKPPLWIRIILIISSIGVSYSHGANDGQKGIGLIMLVLIAITPIGFIVNMNASKADIQNTRQSIKFLEKYYYDHNQELKNIIQMVPFSIFDKISVNKISFCNKKNAIYAIKKSQILLHSLDNYNKLNVNQRIQIRRLLVCIGSIVDKIIKSPNIDIKDKKNLYALKNNLLSTIEYAPMWIIIIIAISLSLGTMIGWKRISTTIIEKIGKKDITYAQGISAQLTAGISICIASYIGMPVSTPHILSSSIAGAILIDGQKIQKKTIKNIILTWIFTIPISGLLSSFFYCVINMFLFFKNF